MKRRPALGLIARAAAIGSPLSLAAGRATARAAIGTGLPTVVRRLLEGPPETIDVGKAALVIAKQVHPGLHVDSYSARIDGIARQVRGQLILSSPSNHVSTIQRINTCLFDQFGMRYDHSPQARSKPSNHFLHGLLDTKIGMCLTMPMLYLAVAQRLDLPVLPVNAPQHSFLRFLAPGRPPHNIEVTSGGGVLTDAEYIRRFSIARRGIESGAYLRTLSIREYVSVMLLQNALVLYPRGKHEEALAYFNAARALDPADPMYAKWLESYWRNAAIEADAGGSALAQRYWKASHSFREVADHLGWQQAPGSTS